MDLHPSAELLIRSVTLHLYTFWIQDSVQISSASHFHLVCSCIHATFLLFNDTIWSIYWRFYYLFGHWPAGRSPTSQWILHYTWEEVKTVRWHGPSTISNSVHTSASSGYHGNRRPFGLVRFVKEALYFSECTENLEIPSHSRTSTYYTCSLHPHVSLIKLSKGPDDKDNVTVCELLCQKRK